MPLVNYMVKARDDAGHLFEKTYQVNAPASILSPASGVETTAFLKTLCSSYTPHIMHAAPFRCVICGDKAATLVHQPFVFLQPAQPLVSDQPTPVCKKGSCDTEIKQNLQAMVHQMERELGSNIANAEIHLCAKCGKAGADKLCSRCEVAAYCSRQCRKDHWSIHKKACHPAKPLAERLSQLM